MATAILLQSARGHRESDAREIADWIQAGIHPSTGSIKGTGLILKMIGPSASDQLVLQKHPQVEVDSSAYAEE